MLYLMFFLSVLGQDDSCQLDLLTIFQSARRHNINFGINFDDLRQVERLWRVDKVAHITTLDKNLFLLWENLTAAITKYGRNL